MTGLGVQQVGSILPPWTVEAWPAILAAIVVGAVVSLVWEEAAQATHPATVGDTMRWFALLPAAGLLLLGIGAALGANEQAIGRTQCTGAGGVNCPSDVSSLYIGSGLWVGEALSVLILTAVGSSGKAAKVLGSRALATGCCVVLLANLLAFVVAGYFLMNEFSFTRPALTALAATELAFVNNGLLVAGLLAAGGFHEGDWGVASRLLAGMNVVPAGFMAFVFGFGMLQGGTIPLAFPVPAFF